MVEAVKLMLRVIYQAKEKLPLADLGLEPMSLGPSGVKPEGERCLLWLGWGGQGRQTFVCGWVCSFAAASLRSER